MSTQVNTQGLTAQDAANYATLIAELTPLALELALKLKGIYDNINSGTATTTALNSEATTADNDVINKVNVWLASKGLPTQ